MASAWGSSWGMAWGNSWGSILAVAQPDTHDGGGWYRHYKHPGHHKKKRKPIADEIRQMYEAMVEIAQPNELAKINVVVADYVEKPTSVYGNLPIKPPSIDWIALTNDLEQVYALARIYDRLLEQEDEAAFMLLM